MKQVVFAIALLAMASLTGCLNTEDAPVDENIDTTDDSTSDTTEDNTDTTQDDTDTTDDTKDDELIDPVGTEGGVTIPEDSSIFIDSMGEPGEWECNGTGKDKECNYVHYNKDAFVSEFEDGNLSHIVYTDSDGIENSIDFNGWVNKTGNTVTIEGLKYPDRGPSVYTQYDWHCCNENGQEWIEEVTVYTYSQVNGWVSNTCNNGSTCQIVFYGHNGLTYNAWFTLSDEREWDYYEDTNNDGYYDVGYKMHEYVHYTVTFDLPFEPYAFSILSGYELEQQYRSVDRIF